VAKEKMNTRFRLPLATIFLAVSAIIGSAQQTQLRNTPALNYGFVSPNTRDGLQLEDAIRGLNSPEELTLLRKVRALRCTVRRPVSSMRALGSWSDGAEHTILLRVYTDESTIRYLMSRLGRNANQKAVLYFYPHERGQARMYIVHPAKRFRSFATLSRLLDEAGISFRTLVPTKQETIVYVVDTESNLSAKMKAAARRLQARLTSQRGSASFIGDDNDREKGQAVFAQEIKTFEAKHPNLPPPCEGN
jgi:hypothetical protein